ncbi:mannosyltransferase (PIG-M) domain-containing protein [Hirsutella rhossiliensis]|uniref:GPI mannosyltransferase 1 n=1 Tax=Hirsutella rhossiliensis TaxID=111463 RepID=A0A9P8SGV4_9HYPO|nr:mannosyltransferase (PIG-M) domain-containing protein [Hirsutella rhossiliensis]KAH0962191.1 mannosyltransferase (PIG-M) domain-containing protein [Hirsutella rhossiliensis]
MSLLRPLLRPTPLFLVAALLRLGLLVYGSWQDAHSAVKYTDVDYLVFTDAARFVVRGSGGPTSPSSSASPYARDTYRYTPLLAWLLAPTTIPGFFAFGKVVFAAADLAAGALILALLRRRRQRRPGDSQTHDDDAAFAALWLWNPMVATISTRGSSEGLLGVLTMALLWAVETRRVDLAGFVLGLAVHFKIYPLIYAPAIVWWMDDERMPSSSPSRPATAPQSPATALVRFCSPARIRLAAVSFATFMSLNLLMYSIYGTPFLLHTYLHHVTRSDHRHNFSPYNVLLYLTSATPSSSPLPRIESLAFVPQMLLSCVLIPLALAKKDLATSMMAQTFAFVTFNKVCTSQYFLWYMVFLPLYLPGSSLLRRPALGIAALALWVAGQAAWLHQGYRLEFLGESTFFPGLWLASLAFFFVNCWILGIIICDGAGRGPEKNTAKGHVE